MTDRLYPSESSVKEFARKKMNLILKKIKSDTTKIHVKFIIIKIFIYHYKLHLKFVIKFKLNYYILKI